MLYLVGAIGVVRRAWLLAPADGGPPIPVAVKLLALPKSSPHALVKSLVTLAQEVNVLSKLNHPNVVCFYGGCLSIRAAFLVEELAAGALCCDGLTCAVTFTWGCAVVFCLTYAYSSIEYVPCM